MKTRHKPVPLSVSCIRGSWDLIVLLALWGRSLVLHALCLELSASLWLGPKDLRRTRKVPALSDRCYLGLMRTSCPALVDLCTQQMQPPGGHETWGSHLRQSSSTYSEMCHLQVPAALLTANVPLNGVMGTKNCYFPSASK